MAKPVHVLLSFIHGRLEKLRDLGREHDWTTSQGTLKNATIAMKIIDFFIDLRYDETYSKIIKREGIPLRTLISRSLTQYAASRGYFPGKSKRLD